MAIVIASDIQNIQPWISALKNADPLVEVITIDKVIDNSDVEFILAWNYLHGLLGKYPRLKTVASMGAGVDHILKDPDLPEKVKIVRLVDPRLSQDMYEFILAVIMNRLRSLTRYRENQMTGLWKKTLYGRISDVNIGVMGTGAIGNHIASRLQAAGFSVSGWRRTAEAPGSYKMYYGNDQLKSFISKADVLICLLPLTPETEGILNKQNMQMLPENSWIVNLGRGGHLVEEDLIELLDSGHLGGANLDVFREEPLPTGHPFWHHKKIFITPHIASLPDPASVAPQILENYRNTIENGILKNTVDRKKGY